MNEHIEWVLDMHIQDGMKGAVQPSVEDMVSPPMVTEPGAITHDYHLTGDGTWCTALEGHADNTAVMTHLDNFGAHVSERFLALFAPERFTVFGPADVAAQAALSAFGAAVATSIRGVHLA